MPNFVEQSHELYGLEAMVVDDEVDVRELLAEHLHGHGLVVTMVPDGDAAVAALEGSNGRFGFVLTDINMPGANGFDVLRAARRANAAAEVVIITGYGSADSAQQAFRLGAHDYLQKPFKLGQLDTILRGIGERLGVEHGSQPAGHTGP
jgi:DNA-binding NtrC family response regulator